MKLCRDMQKELRISLGRSFLCLIRFFNRDAILGISLSFKVFQFFFFFLIGFLITALYKIMYGYTITIRDLLDF